MSDTDTYELEQVFVNPRDGSLGGRTFEVYTTKEEAMREARKHGGLWRINKSSTVWMSKELKNRIEERGQPGDP